MSPTDSHAKQTTPANRTGLRLNPAQERVHAL
jgi:hypothetical protein